MCLRAVSGKGNFQECSRDGSEGFQSVFKVQRGFGDTSVGLKGIQVSFIGVSTGFKKLSLK